MITWSSGETPKLYIDGTLNVLSDDGGSIGGSITGVTKLLVGIGVKGNNWDGMIDDFRIYNRALCSDEIEGIYNGIQPAGVRVISWVEKNNTTLRNDAVDNFSVDIG